MSIKHLAIPLILFSPILYSQEPAQQSTVFFEKDSFKQPELLIKEMPLAAENLVRLSPNSNMDEYINQAIISKNWQQLEQLLSQYKQTENYDRVLYDYGLGALYHFKGNYKKAIQSYFNIINNHPNLHYPRLDLAIMLFQDKQYNEAKKQFTTVRSIMPTTIQKLIDEYLNSIDKFQSWQKNLNFNFERTNNVNQSSDIKEISIGEATFIRDPDSLPQEAQGIGYAVNVTRENNIAHHHYSYLNTTINGVYYWDNNKYSEQTLRLNAGYKFKDIKQSFGIIPFIEKNSLGNARYSQNYGTTLEYSFLLSNKWQISSDITYTKKSYHDANVAQYYDGHSTSQSALTLYQIKSQWLIFGGVNLMQDHLLEESESSHRSGIMSGFSYTGEKLGLSSQLQYAKRNFLADNTWYGTRRKDDEYQSKISIWHKQFQWKGFMPKLNYQYQKIDSNLPLYKRNNDMWFMTLDKKI